MKKAAQESGWAGLAALVISFPEMTKASVGGTGTVYSNYEPNHSIYGQTSLINNNEDVEVVM